MMLTLPADPAWSQQPDDLCTDRMKDMRDDASSAHHRHCRQQRGAVSGRGENDAYCAWNVMFFSLELASELLNSPTKICICPPRNASNTQRYQTLARSIRASRVYIILARPVSREPPRKSGRRSLVLRPYHLFSALVIGLATAMYGKRSMKPRMQRP